MENSEQREEATWELAEIGVSKNEDYTYIYIERERESQCSAVKAECVLLNPSRDPRGGRSDLNPEFEPGGRHSTDRSED